MKYFFLAYYIAVILKGNKKWLQIALAVLFIIIACIKIQSLINFLSGRPASITDLLITMLFIYMVINFLYAILLPDSEIKNNSINKIQNQNIPVQHLEGEKQHIILNTVHYTSTIRTSPNKKIPDAKPVIPVKTKPTLSEAEENAPPLEVNLESAEEFIQREVPDTEYSGVLNENFNFSQLDGNEMESIVITDSQLPDPETILFERVEKKKFI